MGWEWCDGQLLAIDEYESLFNYVGTVFGGDGQSTFALPDLRGRAVAHRSSRLPLGAEGSIELPASQVTAPGTGDPVADAPQLPGCITHIIALFGQTYDEITYADDVLLGEVRAFPGGMPPGWAPCEGSLLPISQNTALFSILQTIYGG